MAADARCQICNVGDDLQVHHRTYVRFGAEWPGDLTVLCADCHQLYHGRFGMRSEAGPHEAQMTRQWERVLEQSVVLLQSALDEAIYRLSVHAHKSKHSPWELEYARRIDARVKRNLRRLKDQWRRKGWV